jgi:hypothetical protein
MYDLKLEPISISTKCKTSMWLAMRKKLWLHNIPA